MVESRWWIYRHSIKFFELFCMFENVHNKMLGDSHQSVTQIKYPVEPVQKHGDTCALESISCKHCDLGKSHNLYHVVCGS